MAYNASPTQNNDNNVVSSAPPTMPNGQAAGTQTSQQQATQAAPQTTSGQSSTITAGQQVPTQSNTQIANSSASTGVQTKPASSGGFTNLQSYMNQNKQAGQQLANRIGTGVNRDFSSSLNSTNRAVTGTQQAYNTTQNDINTGQNYLTQMSQPSAYTSTVGTVASYLNPYINSSSPLYQQAQAAMNGTASTPAPTTPANAFNAQNFANNNSDVNSFAGLRTGTTQNADVNALNTALTGAQQAQGSTQQLATNLQNELGTSANRANLLSQYVNQAPQYSQSAQNLDTYFLQKANGDLNNLQNQVKNTQNTSIKDIANQINALQTGTTNASNAGTALATNLQNQANANVSSLTNQLQNNIQSTNDIRTAQQAWAQDQYSKLQQGQPVDPQFAQMLGLTQGQQLYNVVGNNTANSFLNLSPAQASTIQDVANSQDVAQYQALAKLAGVSPNSYALTQASALSPAVANNNQLAAALTGAQQDLANTAINTTGTGFGSTGSAQASLNEQQLINALNKANVGYNLSSFITPDMGGDIYSQLLGQGQVQNQDVRNLVNAISPNLSATGGSDLDRANAEKNAIIQGLQQLANSGYYNTVSVANPGKVQGPKIT